MIWRYFFKNVTNLILSDLYQSSTGPNPTRSERYKQELSPVRSELWTRLNSNWIGPNWSLYCCLPTEIVGSYQYIIFALSRPWINGLWGHTENFPLNMWSSVYIQPLCRFSDLFNKLSMDCLECLFPALVVNQIFIVVIWLPPITNWHRLIFALVSYGWFPHPTCQNYILWIHVNRTRRSPMRFRCWRESCVLVTYHSTIYRGWMFLTRFRT